MARSIGIFKCSFLMFVAFMAGIALVIIFKVAANSFLPRTEYSLVLKAVENHQVSLGDSMYFWHPIPSGQPIIEYEITGSDQNAYQMSVFYHRGESLTLYGKNDLLIGAQYARGMIDVSLVQWYFADTEAIQNCILAMAVENTD